MKREANHENKEAKLSKLLFNKKEDLVKNLQSYKNNNEVIEDDFKPAWVDEDDHDTNAKSEDKTSISKTRKRKYETLMGTPSWAVITKDNTDKNNKIEKTVGHLHKAKGKEVVSGLKGSFLEFKRLQHINQRTHGEGVITCIEFHPKSSVALVFGKSRIVSLFSIGGKYENGNQKLHSIKLTKWGDNSRAFFTPDGNEAFLSCDRFNFYYVYDLIKAEANLHLFPKNAQKTKHFQLSPDGKYIAVTDQFDGVYLICAKSKELLRHLKQNSNIASLVFSPDSSYLYCYGEQGEVTFWDLSVYRAVKRFYDHACVKGSCIAVSPCGRLLATGSCEGIVNIYHIEDITTAEPTPTKILSNLTTKITLLKFNPTTEILAVGSNVLNNALKLYHIPTYHAFKNFPQSNISLAKVHTLAFSPGSGYMAIGNDKGTALLFRLTYFKNY